MDQASSLIGKIDDRSVVVGVAGLGYVGLPLVLVLAGAGFRVVGFDVDRTKCDVINRGESYISHIDGERVRRMVDSGHIQATDDPEQLTRADAILVCVPTPLNAHREPDLRHVLETGRTIGKRLRPGQLVVLESTTYPGTTDTNLREVLEEESGLDATRDFMLAFSPEREDPGNPVHHTAIIPKVVGGLTPEALKATSHLYSQVVRHVVPVSSTRVAEASKILENTYRAVNIALVNELKVLFDRMEIDIWEVIEAAKTKPFGFQPFHPGPGLGGHCVPIDPFYLTWKAREYDVTTRFIELAGEVNASMPYYVVNRCTEALNLQRRSLNGARILVLGMAYKKNVDDTRESPSIKLADLLSRAGASVSYHDPHIPKCGRFRHFPHICMESVPLTQEVVASCDLVLVATDHDRVDYEMVARHARLIVDTRNVFCRLGIHAPQLVKA